MGKLKSLKEKVVNWKDEHKEDIVKFLYFAAGVSVPIIGAVIYDQVILGDEFISLGVNDKEHKRSINICRRNKITNNYVKWGEREYDMEFEETGKEAMLTLADLIKDFATHTEDELMNGDYGIKIKIE